MPNASVWFILVTACMSSSTVGHLMMTDDECEEKETTLALRSVVTLVQSQKRTACSIWHLGGRVPRWPSTPEYRYFVFVTPVCPLLCACNITSPFTTASLNGSLVGKKCRKIYSLQVFHPLFFPSLVVCARARTRMHLSVASRAPACVLCIVLIIPATISAELKLFYCFVYIYRLRLLSVWNMTIDRETE